MMTTPTPTTPEALRRVVHEEAREVIRDYTCLPFGLGEAQGMCSRITDALLASPALRDAIALGMAWAAVEAVLPEGWDGPDVISGKRGCMAQVFTGKGRGEAVHGEGATPTEALTALHAALLARGEGSR